MKKAKKKFGFYVAILSAALTGSSYQADAQNWLVTGNAPAAGNFLGTTNTQDLRFRTNNTQKMVLTQTGSLGIGTASPTNKLQIAGVGGGTIDLKVNGRIQTGDAGNAGGIWCNSALTQFFGQIEASIAANTVGIYNNGWRFAISNNGFTGIGTAVPASKLDVMGSGAGTIDFKVNGRILTGDAGNSGGIWCNSGLTQFVGQLNSSTLGLYNGGWALAVSNTGKIGIGTANPITPLHVEGANVLLSRIKRTSTGTDLTALAEIENGSGAVWRYGVAGTGNGLGINNGQFYIEKTSSGVALVISSNRNVLINKLAETNSIYRLDVNGEMRANGITVNTTGADFVFEADYKLNKLECVEQFIKENHHLPQVPSAKEMTESGMNIGELNKTLLQKVEELTLYIIDQNKRIVMLESERNAK